MAVAKAAQALIRDQMKMQREKAKVGAAKAKAAAAKEKASHKLAPEAPVAAKVAPKAKAKAKAVSEAKAPVKRRGRKPAEMPTAAYSWGCRAEFARHPRLLDGVLESFATRSSCHSLI